MCGIVGAVAGRPILPLLLNGLRNLEYRGYDSAGVALIESDDLMAVRVVGKVQNLVHALEVADFEATLGIAHTRWATHGEPHERNAHPHRTARLALVHNGIIENYSVLKAGLQQRGVHFHSETDSEVIVQRLQELVSEGLPLSVATQRVLAELQGAFSFVVFDKQQPNQLVAARRGSPLVIGLGLGEHFVASDTYALATVTQSFVALEEGDVAVIGRLGVQIIDAAGQWAERPIFRDETAVAEQQKGTYRHFMQKEIFEQPKALAATLAQRVTPTALVGDVAQLDVDWVETVQIVACGTSYHAALVARYWFEAAGIPTQVEVASEFRYRDTVRPPKTLFIAISQSGETADTLAALRKATQAGYDQTLAICNVENSALVREADGALLTHAGREIGVASTKAFTTQLLVLALLALRLRRYADAQIQPPQFAQLLAFPKQLETLLQLDEQIAELATQFVDCRHALFLGRGELFPIALEGALKLKEISYIHAEGYPAGELKHGPLALVDNEMPVIALVSRQLLHDKLLSNLQEIKARNGRLFLFADTGVESLLQPGDFGLNIGEVPPFLAPIWFTVPLQLLAYHVAVLKGTDVDQPRNLAKSVTVE